MSFVARTVLIALVAVGGLAGGTSAATAEPSAGRCEITGGSLTWGVKESFRAYISGTIANGGWEVSDGASYETPTFGWSPATGSIDRDTGAGSVSFTGTVRFTGHDGILDMTLANPTVEFAEDGHATLLLDTRGTDTSGEVAVDVTQQPVADLGVIGPVDPTSGTMTFTDVPVALSEAGAPAFADFYQPGEALDPLTLVVEVAPCGGEEPGDAAQDADATPAAVEEDEGDSSSTPWLPIGLGAGAAAVAGGAGTALYVRKRSS
ncbi:hypothetical protein D9V41_14295 [Aeromicrobium phragmitis]|uniref:Htaa domain-containing protein n=1 Tax=Aeromicrobium phragmitis TaxID=2478914 RepID=A0A3L8PK54_9ACTN|nr:HtaA domain-containing protein [Aeromicrobium phragmitis]RLV54978.1 hypothetical protein D9V41_14295 [Aeromicrobium phragmitis]